MDQARNNAANGSGAAQPPEEAPTRRGFLRVGLLVWGAFFTWLGTVFHLFLRFMFPRVLYEPSPRFRAGRLTDYAERNRVYDAYKARKDVFLVRLVEDGEDRLVAVSTICTHLGCRVNWSDAKQKFKCPCHGSGFRMDGVKMLHVSVDSHAICSHAARFHQSAYCVVPCASDTQHHYAA